MNYRTVGGLTLVELLISLTLLAALCLSLPSLGNMLHKQRLLSGNSDLRLLINRARQDAISLHARITLCSLANDGSCQHHWTGTISEFVDNNGNRALDTGESEIARIQLHSSVKVQWRGMKPTNSIHFSSLGSTFVSNGTFSLCHPHYHETLKLIINKQGRPRSERLQQSC